MIKNNKTLSFWKTYIAEWVMDIAIAGIIVLVLTTFIIQNMYVVGNSMFPTLKHKEIVVINKLAYRLSSPKKYDIIAFKHVDLLGNEQKFVKRIVGLPGDTVEMIDNMIYVNGEATTQSVTSVGAKTPSKKGDMSYPIIVPKDCYFVLGDNGKNSIDSRYLQVGMIPKNQLIGKIAMRIWPIWKITVFN